MTDSKNLKLYAIYLGWYDEEFGFSVYESHTTVFAVAASAHEAKQIAKDMPMYKVKKMHTDGIQEIQAVQGYRLHFTPDENLQGTSVLKNLNYTQINPNE